MSVYAAVDLGASSGRVITVRIDGDRVSVDEVHRFTNRPVRAAGTLHWDILALHQGMLDGLRLAGQVDSIGIDSWAVDYGLLDGDGRLLGNPVHYRDGRTVGVAESMTDTLGNAELYQVTGLQFLPFNTIYQLLAEPLLDRAQTLLMIPDLLTYWLTGSRGAEVTNASTTGLYDVRAGTWASGLATRLGIPSGILPELRRPGAPSGTLRAEIAEETGLSPATPVTAVASHDTASAVAAVPARIDRFAYISSGTWSLVGLESPHPVLSEESRLAGFSNETGLDGTIRYLRNVMGLWILQESVRAWGDGDLPALLRAAEQARPFQALIDPDDPAFLSPGDMPARIDAYCVRTGQHPPDGRAATVRCVLESLALAYRRTIDDAVRLSGQKVEVVHLVGGGARNALLCQMTADATGLPVVAGPVEAAALGNALVQARAQGVVTDIRDLVRRGEQPITYQPRGDQDTWTRAGARLPFH
ncbi:rhamnulokinase family protein [Planotetraspora phitsanulokensis]|uniref:Carbohydrate kinase n=1 Tax=Planotetraspora phitsanulokensis TaxID=575192 RepID=A0A8J3U6W8_9ACTN|nr:rhamnulokinase family protein [Planotetraspora phitsanulokensis]GII38142.1 carbohydrate kinase [Planotetraspora phitsanulokensis]